MNVRSTFSVAVILMTIVSPADVLAQFGPFGINWSIPVDRLLYLEVNGGAISFNTADALDFQAGFAPATAGTLVTHRGNVPHSVLIEATTGVFSASGALANPSKPTSDLEFRVNGGPWTAVPFGSTAFIHSPAAMGAYDADDNVDYRILLAWASDSPGAYSVDVIFTIIAN